MTSWLASYITYDESDEAAPRLAAVLPEMTVAPIKNIIFFVEVRYQQSARADSQSFFQPFGIESVLSRQSASMNG